jgi:hypothetical protein
MIAGSVDVTTTGVAAGVAGGVPVAAGAVPALAMKSRIKSVLFDPVSVKPIFAAASCRPSTVTYLLRFVSVRSKGNRFVILHFLS